MQAGVKTENFQITVNEALDLVEKFAEQQINNVRGVNPFDSVFEDLEVANGTDIEKAVVEMAKEGTYDPDAAPIWDAPDPKFTVNYFSQWTDKQFKTKVRRNEIRKICLGQKSPEDVAAMIIKSLGLGESDADFIEQRQAFIGDYFVDYADLIGKTPKNMTGVLYLVREMYKHLIATNADCRKGIDVEDDLRAATPEEDVIIVLSDKLVNLIDVTELANTFNLSKEEMFGRIITYSADDLDPEYQYIVCVIDKKAIVRGRRTYEYSLDRSGAGLFDVHYLTTSRLYGVCNAFKGLQIDVSAAAAAQIAELVDDVE